LIVLIGGKTGRDGIHGATFASDQLTDESGAKSYTSVQIGNPIVEKKVIDILLQARDRVYIITLPIAAPAAYPPRSGKWAKRPGRGWTWIKSH